MAAPEKPLKESSAEDRWTTRGLLSWMTRHFEAKSIDSPRVISEMLMAHVLKCDRMRLYMEVDRLATDAERASLRELVGRASQHEPVQYILGEAYFFSRRFLVNASTLIPRPSTETLVEHIIQGLRGREDLESLRIADIATGSGCIAISLALGLPGAKIIASDISTEALKLARSNAQLHKVQDSIDFRQGSLFEPLDGENGFDVICANPPYIPDHEWDAVEANVKDHEPPSALRGGVEGLDFIGPLLTGAGRHLRDGGQLVLEIADSHHVRVMELAREAGFQGIKVLKDHEGCQRVLVANH